MQGMAASALRSAAGLCGMTVIVESLWHSMEYFFKEVSVVLWHALECLQCFGLQTVGGKVAFFRNVEDASIPPQDAKKMQKYVTQPLLQKYCTHICEANISFRQF